MLENKLLKIIFGCKGEEATGGWRKLHSEKFHNWYSLHDDIIKINDEMDKTCSTHGDHEKLIEMLILKT